MTVAYELTEDIHLFGSASRISYGIAAYAAAENSGAALLFSISDITPDRTKLEKLVRDCNPIITPFYRI